MKALMLLCSVFAVGYGSHMCVIEQYVEYPDDTYHYTCDGQTLGDTITGDTPAVLGRCNAWCQSTPGCHGYDFRWKGKTKVCTFSSTPCAHKQKRFRRSHAYFKKSNTPCEGFTRFCPAYELANHSCDKPVYQTYSKLREACRTACENDSNCGGFNVHRKPSGHICELLRTGCEKSEQVPSQDSIHYIKHVNGELCLDRMFDETG